MGLGWVGRGVGVWAGDVGWGCGLGMWMGAGYVGWGVLADPGKGDQQEVLQCDSPEQRGLTLTLWGITAEQTCLP